MLACANFATAQEYSVRATVTDGEGKTGPFAAHQMVKVKLEYLEAGSDTPATDDIEPRAWFRSTEPHSLNCTKSVNVEYGKNSVALAGHLIVSLNEDNTVTFTDPLVKEGRANIFAAVRLPEKPMTIVPASGELLALLPNMGSVLAISASGETRIIATGLLNPTALASAFDAALVADDNGVTILNDKKERTKRMRFPEKIIGLQWAGEGAFDDERSPYALAFGAEGGIYGLDIGSGQRLWQRRSQLRYNADQPMLANSTAALLPSENGNGLDILYWPSRNAPVASGAPFPVEGMVVGRSKDFALAWSNSKKLAAPVDLRSGTWAREMPLLSPVNQAIFSGWSVFLSHANSVGITMIDLGPVATTGVPSSVELAVESDDGEPVSIASFLDDGQLLVNVPSRSEARVYGQGQSTTARTFTALKGAKSTKLWLLDRKFRRLGNGKFETTARLPTYGPVQLMTSSGLGGTTACFDVMSTAPSLPRQPSLALVSPHDTYAKDYVGSFHIVGDLPDQMQLPERVALRAQLVSLEATWWTEVTAMRRGEVFDFQINFPVEGQYALTLPDLMNLKPVRMDVGK